MEPTIMSHKEFSQLLVSKPSKIIDTKSFNDGSKAHLITFVEFVCVLVNKTPFIFRETRPGAEFFHEMKSPPPGTVKREYTVDYQRLQDPLNLNYRLLTYKFYENTKLYRGWVRRLSENVLNDGRLSILWVETWGREGNARCDYTLAIGRLVFAHSCIETLRRFELAIDDGSATFWRPELAGTMDHIPKYNISTYDEIWHKKYTAASLLFRKCEIRWEQSAFVYKFISKTTRYYMRWLDKLYFFSSIEDCDLIISQLKASARPLPSQDNADLNILSSSIKVIATRLSRIMSADMNYSTYQPLFTIAPNGELNSKSAAI